MFSPLKWKWVYSFCCF